MGLRDRAEDLWDAVTEFARAPLPRGSLPYRWVGRWLRAACWTFLVIAALMILAVLASGAGLAYVIFSGMSGWDALGYASAFGGFLLFSVFALTGAALVVAGTSLLYGAWTRRARRALWALRAIGGLVTLLGAPLVLFRFSPLALFVVAALVPATGLLVLALSVLPAVTREFGRADPALSAEAALERASR